MSYRCPKCGRDSTLWRGVTVPGWESVDADLKVIHRTSMDRDVDWSSPEEDGTYGCGECGWEGTRKSLERVDKEGNPLVEPNPNQQTLLQEDSTTHPSS